MLDGSSPLSRGIRCVPVPRWRSFRIIPALAGNTRGWVGTFVPPGDHPRSRGEYRIMVLGMAEEAGSSPLSRGILLCLVDGRQVVRIIPALAGNTYLPLTLGKPAKDHPRSRGEYTPRGGSLLGVLGSSPLSRGIPLDITGDYRRFRIIPALAGNTRCSTTSPAPCKDHPRSRGEYPRDLTEQTTAEGSSPLSRGILRACCGEVEGERIIPALAGNTQDPRRVRTSERDHPRSRGEYAMQDGQVRESSGSSPLSRGIRGWGAPGLGGGGIIPALAGNTVTDARPHRASRDHPRSRGEYFAAVQSGGTVEGSSPLSRGIRFRARHALPPRGIIPALAGNTGRAGSRSSAGRDHPRSRGEYDAAKVVGIGGNGSSPLSRGIHTQARRGLRHHGIIPALAGNT